MDEAKTAKISNLWTFLPVIQLKDHLLTSGRTPFCPTVHRLTTIIDLQLRKKLCICSNAKHIVPKQYFTFIQTVGCYLNNAA